MEPSPQAISTALLVAEAFGTLAFAVSGLIAAAGRKFDAVGVVMVAGVTAFGGGTLRDVLLERRPFFWVERVEWLWALLVLCLLAMLLLRARHFGVTRRALLWPDAIGLGLFTANGAQLALAMGMPALVCVLMGMITAVFGGVLRDVLCNDLPAVFSDHRPYAVCSFAGGWVLLGAHALGSPVWLALIVATLATASLRMAAVFSDWSLPPWKTHEDA